MYVQEEEERRRLEKEEQANVIDKKSKLREKINRTSNFNILDNKI